MESVWLKKNSLEQKKVKLPYDLRPNKYYFLYIKDNDILFLIKRLYRNTILSNSI